MQELSHSLVELLLFICVLVQIKGILGVYRELLEQYLMTLGLVDGFKTVHVVLLCKPFFLFRGTKQRSNRANLISCL